MPELPDENPRLPDNAPMVSIIVPARDEESNIEHCIRSLLSQDYPRFEVIVVNDCSEDATGSILARLGSGSASRSLYSGFVQWHAGKRADGGKYRQVERVFRRPSGVWQDREVRGSAPGEGRAGITVQAEDIFPQQQAERGTAERDNLGDQRDGKRGIKKEGLSRPL